eukprot:SAG11_NODE_26770_length_341_cov_0.334711_1_plen_29_part_10
MYGTHAANIIILTKEVVQICAHDAPKGEG